MNIHNLRPEKSFIIYGSGVNFIKKTIFFITGDMQDKLVPGVFEPKAGLIFTGKARAHPSGLNVKKILP